MRICVGVKQQNHGSRLRFKIVTFDEFGRRLSRRTTADPYLFARLVNAVTMAGIAPFRETSADATELPVWLL